MRLYSQRIIYFTLALGLILGLILGLFLGSSFFFNTTENPSNPETVQSAETLPLSLDKEISLPVTPVQTGIEYSQDELNSISVYERVNEAVVHITTEVVRLNWFLEPVPTEGGTGSGSIIDARGYVLTNNHVVEGASRLFINLADGSQFEAEIVGTDPESDLAVIKFNPGNRQLPTIPLGSSEGLRVGQKVLAIGNPFGFDRTLTTGIVSALGRPIQGRNGIIIQGMIQTDASINPGNSGGPLLNSRGEMIGINTMIYSTSGGSVGIGFAVPVNTAKRVVPDLIQFGSVQRGWIDVVPVQIFPALVRAGRLPVSKGLLVSQVNPGGAADRAGIRGGSRDRGLRYGRTIIYLGGDIIVSVAGQEVASIGQLFSVLETSKPGDRVVVGLVRPNGQREEVTVTLSPRPKNISF